MVTAPERLAKVVEVLATGAYYGPPRPDAHERAAEALAPLLDEFQAEDEVRGAARVREAVEGLHRPVQCSGWLAAWCAECRQQWPCRTSASLDAAGGCPPLSPPPPKL